MHPEPLPLRKRVSISRHSHGVFIRELKPNFSVSGHLAGELRLQNSPQLANSYL